MAVPRNATNQQQPHTEKFYKGSHSDTPWNKDLLWRYHVTKEDKQEKVNLGERLPNDATVKRRQERMVMGMTGTLIPDITPRQNHLHQMERQLLASSSGKRLMLHENSPSDARSTASRGTRSRKTESICSRTPSSSSILSSSSSSSSLRSMRLQDVQEILASQSRLLKEKTDEELSGIRHALQEEVRKREEAERKIHFLCEKLGISD